MSITSRIAAGRRIGVHFSSDLGYIGTMEDKNSPSLGNDFSSRGLGATSVPHPVVEPIVVRKPVTRVDGRKASVLIVDFARINCHILVAYVEGN